MHNCIADLSSPSTDASQGDVTPPPARKTVETAALESAPSDVQIALLTEAGGGVMRHVIDLSRGLAKRGWNTTLIVSPRRIDERYLAEIQSLDQSQVVYVEMDRAPNTSDLKAYLALRSALKKLRGRRILHAHSTKAGLLGTALQPEVDALAYTPHAYRAIDPNLSPVTRRLLRSVEMAYSRPYDRIIAVSQSEREYTLACGVAPERVTCIPNGIDLKGIDFDALRKRRLPASQTISLGFVGRFAYQKNPQLFVETLANLAKRGHDVKAVIVGDGELQGEMMALAERLGVAERIDWRGAVTASEALNDMDIMVHTSRYEAMPYTLLEAAAALLPVVATDNHGSRSVLQGELADNIMTEATAEKFGDRILQLVQDRVLWAHQLDLLEQTAHTFSLETMVANIEQVYLDLLAKRPELSKRPRRYMGPVISRIWPFAAKADAPSLAHGE
jgi:glycosyltransferase involved in cell wall biosynthesis